MFIRDRDFSNNLISISEILNEWSIKEKIKDVNIFYRLVAHKVRRLEINFINSAYQDQILNDIQNINTNNEKLMSTLTLINEWALNESVYNSELTYFIRENKVQHVKIQKGYKHFYDSDDKSQI